MAAIQSVAMLILIWFEVGLGLGWRDLVFAISCGFVLTSIIATIILIAKRRRAKDSRLHIPTHGIPGFLFYWCAFILVRGIPAADSYLFHPLNTKRTGIISIFGWSAWMALVFAISGWFSRRNSTGSSVTKLDLDAISEHKSEQ